MESGYTELNKLIESFNKNVIKKYINDKLDIIEIKYKENNFDIIYLKWLGLQFTTGEKDLAINSFIEYCRKNNYFIPKLSAEIEENSWRWTHFIWKLFYDYLNNDYKRELNDYMEKLKKENLISAYRINLLQENKPLIKN